MTSNPRIAALIACVLICVLVVAMPATALADLDDETVQHESHLEWWTPSYLVDYGIVAGGIAGYIIGERISPRRRAMIGPSYDPLDPTPVFDSETVGRTHLDEGVEDTVPTVWIHRMVAGGAFFVAGVEGVELAQGDSALHYFHDAFVGYAETVAVTATVTSMIKPFVGRLRPDFGERALRYHCNYDDPERFGSQCDNYEDRPLGANEQEGRELIDDGQRSFISGHSSHSFNILGYTALLVGGRYVWSDDATTTSQTIGIASQAAMLGSAAFIAGSRVTDGRHHLSDTLVGTAVGLGIANASYWRRFQRDGSLRTGSNEESTASTSLSAQPTLDGPGVSLTLQF